MTVVNIVLWQCYYQSGTERVAGYYEHEVQQFWLQFGVDQTWCEAHVETRKDTYQPCHNQVMILFAILLNLFIHYSSAFFIGDRLSISRIYNLIDTRFETIYKCNVSPAVWQIIESEAAKLCVGKENYLSCGAIKMFGQIVEQQSSKAMLKFIDKEKYLLSSCDKEDTEEYTVLLLVEQV